MYIFGPRSRKNLNECRGDLQVIFDEVIKIIDCSVIEGHRPQVEQDKAFAEERSKVRWPNSMHNREPSLAADVAPYPIIWGDEPGIDRQKAIGRFYLLGGIVIGTAHQLFLEGKITHKVRWGGDWDMDGDIMDQRFEDLVHFELRQP